MNFCARHILDFDGVFLRNDSCLPHGGYYLACADESMARKDDGVVLLGSQNFVACGICYDVLAPSYGKHLGTQIVEQLLLLRLDGSVIRQATKLRRYQVGLATLYMIRCHYADIIAETAGK